MHGLGLGLLLFVDFARHEVWGTPNYILDDLLLTPMTFGTLRVEATSAPVIVTAVLAEVRIEWRCDRPLRPTAWLVQQFGRCERCLRTIRMECHQPFMLHRWCDGDALADWEVRRCPLITSV